MIGMLTGLISSTDLEMVRVATLLRFEDPDVIEAPECLILAEQGVLPRPKIKELYEKKVGVEVQTPVIEFLPKQLIDELSATQDCVPFKYDSVKECIYVGVLPKDMHTYRRPVNNKEIIAVPVPIYWFVENYTALYAKPRFIKNISPLELFNFIINEAIDLGAADITISSRASHALIYYKVRGQQIRSKRSIQKLEVEDIIKFVMTKAKSMVASNFRKPVRFSMNISTNFRGRCEVNKTYHGLTLTIRMLPNDLYSTTLEELNIEPKTINFIRDVIESKENGLRIFVGPTLSGKNTTTASILMEMLGDFKLKGISVEQPVELLMDFLEQIDAPDEETYFDNIASLLRQNPDIIYVTEMTDYTAKSIMNVANTGKRVFTSLHANTLADVVSRIHDLTGYSIDRVVQNIQSLVYQELVRDEENDRLLPRTRCIHFDKSLRESLYGKTLGEATIILREKEEEWHC